ncbi:hypothetical protein L810_0888 [Burkholderia sp. AU4i]|nr:hypothetical protein L810_0888 [Burkholderia sp. AU4i]
MWCVHVRTTRRADTPCTGVGKRVGAILGKSVLLPGARLSFMGPERAAMRPSWPATGPGGTRSSARSRAARMPFRRGAGCARRRLQRCDPRVPLHLPNP